MHQLMLETQGGDCGFQHHGAPLLLKSIPSYIGMGKEGIRLARRHTHNLTTKHGNLVTATLFWTPHGNGTTL